MPDDETKLELDGLQKQLSKLQSGVAKIEGTMASSWALQSREEYEKGLRESIKQDTTAFLLKLTISAAVLLAGAGYLFIKSAVADVYDSRNKEVILDLQGRYDNLVNLDKKRYEWQRHHNYGSELVNLAEFYMYLPVDEKKKKEIVKNLLRKSEDYFNQALTHDARQAATYWELAELKYTYPSNFSVQEQIDVETAIQHYERAIPLYTDADRLKGWKGDCYFRLGKIFQARALTGSGKHFADLATQNLKEARKEYEASTMGNSGEISSRLGEINALLNGLNSVTASK